MGLAYLSITVVLVGLWISANSVSGFRSLESLDGLYELPEEVDAGGARSSILPVSPLEIGEAEMEKLQGSLPKLYHSPEIFSLSYDEMWKQMQIWVYPSQEARYEHKYDGTVGATEDLTSTADLFFRLLLHSEFVTENPTQAQLFLMPVSMDALWLEVGPAGVAEQFKRYVQKVRTGFPYWDRSLGADHLYLSCHAFDRASKHRNFLELGKNSIQAACAPLRHKQVFYPHKDMVFPEYKPVITQQQIRAAVARRGVARAILAYFPATRDASSVLDLHADADFDIESDPTPHRSAVHAKLASSKFCVSLPPYDALSVVDALRFGCVPVLVAQSVLHDLPFQGFLNWRQFSIVLGMEDLPNLKTILLSVAPAKYVEMQYLGHQASKHLEWNNPPVAYDAFHMTLLELWVRRHSVKYARRAAAASA